MVHGNPNSVRYRGFCPLHPDVDTCRCCDHNVTHGNMNDKVGMGLWKCLGEYEHKLVAAPMAPMGRRMYCSIDGATMVHIDSGVYDPTGGKA